MTPSSLAKRSYQTCSPMMQTLPQGTRMIATGVVTPFFVPIKVTMMAAFVVALPFILWQAWAFIAPGLYAHEKRLALPLVLGSTLLFLIGQGVFLARHMHDAPTGDKPKD